MNLPNIISLARLLCAPLIVWLLLTDAWTWAFGVFFAAGLSDAVDGYLAKRLDMRSFIGAYLDPIADKTLLVSIYLTLSVKGQLALWLVILVVSRDLLIIGGALLLFTLNQPTGIKPSLPSKLNTLLQITLAALVIGGLAFELDGLAVPIQVLGVAVGATTVISGTGYLVAWTRRLADMENAS
ncbi:MAG: CDP-alcohol phosphatidyltransferase family protein [Alphaproteobacteria bacterium]|nr:CDP-alcohol phosphatidyltransferase family protein [Alphaproteobacteria bacterium]